MRVSGTTFLILLTTVLAAAVSCVSTDARMKDLTFLDSHGDSILFDGQPFSGTAWSDDGKTLKIEVKDGEIVNFKIYHENGSLACEGKRGADGKYKPRFWTEEGNEYRKLGGLEKEFFGNYPEVRNALYRISIGTPDEEKVKERLGY